MYYAHSTPDPNRDTWQPLPVHLAAVAGLAEAFGRPLGLGRAARVAGLGHDLGKYSAAFLARLGGSREPVDHSTAGAWMIRELCRTASLPDRLMAELIGYAILGHHAGLPDRTGAGSLSERLAGFSPAALAPEWRAEIPLDAAGLAPTAAPRPTAYRDFRFALLGRMLFSCLVDADYRDTEAFYAATEGWTPERDWPALGAILPDLVARFDAHMAGMPKADTAVNALRGEILAHVRARATLPPGLFTLTVPTGGGKTLASLGFALDHAARHGHRRIVYAIPFTSIIEQTAAIFGDVLGDGVVLEHHSNTDDAGLEKGGGRDKLRLAMEDWAAPVVVTTNVQLFESLFSARPGRCRKLHNLAGAVIVLDEAQTLPRPLMIPCVRALDELAAAYGCTIILCTATQPALDARHLGETHPLGLALEGRELAPDPSRLARALGRVTVRRAGEMTNADLVASLGDAPQGLVIVNSRAHALDLHRAATEVDLAGVVHLTTRQHAHDRRLILDDIRARLKAGEPCRVIATSLVEAGVDVDFPRVWRAEAGLDQIAQAAGRCNREGKRRPEDSIVTVFRAPDYPMPREIRDLVGDFGRMVDKHAADLLAPEAIRDFFGETIWRLDTAGLDRHGIMKLFRLNGAETDFAYRTVDGLFRLIATDMQPVIVATEEAARPAVDKLGIAEIPTGRLARELQGFIVQVPRKARDRLIACGHVTFAAPKVRGDQFAVLRTPSLYTRETGLIWEDAEYLSIDNIVL